MEAKESPYDYSVEMKSNMQSGRSENPPNPSNAANGSLELRMMWITMTVMVTLDLLCTTRFLLMIWPIVDALGPFFLAIPFAIYGCLNLLLDLVFLTARNDNMPSAFSCCRWMQAVNPSGHDSQKAFVTIRAGMITIAYWSVIDIIFSIFMAMICQFLITEYAIEPDDTITLGQETFHLYLTISFYLFCLAASFRGVIYIITPFYLAMTSQFCTPENLCKKMPKLKFDCSEDSRRQCAVCCVDLGAIRDDVDVAVDMPESFHRYRGIIAWFAMLLFFLSIGGVSFTVHDILSVLYYGSEDYANYADCEPNSPSTACFLPFPSSYWEYPNATSVTGRSVSISSEAMPYTRQQVHMSYLLNGADGFPVGSMVLWHLAEADGTGYVSTHNIADSMFINSTTVLINLGTMTIIPHFTEIDLLEEDLEQKISYSQPAEVLEFATHYALVVQSLTSSDGFLIQPSDATWAYLYTYVSNGTQPGGDFEEFFDDNYRNRYNHLSTTVFPVLEAMGIDFNDVQLVVDFHTASEAGVLGDIRAMRDLSNARIDYELATSSIEDLYTIPKSRTWGCPASFDNDTDDVLTLKSSYYFSVTVPWFLDEASHFANLETGLLDLNDTYLTDVDSITAIPMQEAGIGLLVRVPCAVASGSISANGILYFGHGVLGSRADMERTQNIELANRNGFILVSMDWRGLSVKDILVVARALLYDSKALTSLKSNILQGFVGNDAVLYMLDAILTQERSKLGIPLSVVISDLPKVYYGYSLGGMFGSGFAAFHGQFSRSLFGIPGSPMSFVIGRSSDFSSYAGLASFHFFNGYQLRFFVSALQPALEVAESAGYARTSAYSNMPVLFQAALGDSQVSAASTAIMSRQLNSQILDPSPTSLPYNYGLLHEAAPVVLPAGTSRLVIYEFLYEIGIVPTDTSEIPESTSAHECLGLYPQAFEQAVRFLNVRDNASAPALVNSACGVDYCTEDEEVTCEHIYVRT